jgi:hypothetical protein
MADYHESPTYARALKLKVLYPPNNFVLEHDSFVATGVGDKEIASWLEDQNHKAYWGFVLRQPPQHSRWIVYFKQIPAGQYTLFVKDVGNAQDSRRGNITSRKLAPIITYPTSKAQLCPTNFVPYGTSDAPVTSARMTPSVGSSINADYLFNNEGFWSAQFPDLPEDNNYRLDVCDGGCTSRQSLEVQFAHCS